MSVEAAFPIFVFEGNDLSLFDDIHTLTTTLEGVDIEDGMYQAYDSRGRVIGLEAHGVKRGVFMVEIGTVVVSGISARPSVEEFEERLRSYLKACGADSRREMSAEELIHACINRARSR
ncbi:hypothetical protein [Polaromonas sp.]|uniref:hypothetical protein n=1 Tax=Polaromonas sp. TaxID=1869339 RepID=UPI003C87945F